MKKTKNNKFGTVNYSVGDFLIQIKNAAMAKNKSIEVPLSKQKFAIAECLKKLGYLDEVEKGDKTIKLSLAFKHKRPTVIDLRLVSKPGLRIYLGVDELSKKKGPSQLLVSTPMGILSSKQAIKQRMGGEVIAEIW